MYTQMLKQKNRFIYRGFTLLELLVVISIISLLMTILMPYIAMIREQAYNIACTRNIKNLTIAWSLYAENSNNKLCCANTGGYTNDLFENYIPGNDPNKPIPTPSYWVSDGPQHITNTQGGTIEAFKNGVLWPYIGNPKTYKCKSDQTSQLRSYAISHAMHGEAAPCVNCIKKEFKLFHDRIQIKNPSSKAVFVDAASSTDWIVGAFSPFKKYPNGPFLWDQSKSRNITSRHFKGFNLSFADLSVGRYEYKDERSIKLSNWDIGAYEASLGKNKDLDNMIRYFSGHK